LIVAMNLLRMILLNIVLTCVSARTRKVINT
jgi:hypothetical protein